MSKFIFHLAIIFLSLGLAGCSTPNPTVDNSQSKSSPQHYPVLPTNMIAPPPHETDVINTFFSLINDQRPEEAIKMMTPNLIGSDSNRQQWLEQFQSFNHVEVQASQPSFPDQWTDDYHTYKVTLIAILTKGENQPIPFYGWGENPNTRWLSLRKNSQNLWQIDNLATGP